MTAQAKKFLLILLCVLATGAFGYYISLPHGYAHTMGEYTIYTTKTIHRGLCAITVVEDSKGSRIAKLQICEDEIESISEEGDYTIIMSSRGGIYKKNINTGEEFTEDPLQGFSGMTIVESIF